MHIGFTAHYFKNGFDSPSCLHSWVTVAAVELLLTQQKLTTY